MGLGVLSPPGPACPDFLRPLPQQTELQCLGEDLSLFALAVAPWVGWRGVRGEQKCSLPRTCIPDVGASRRLR